MQLTPLILCVSNGLLMVGSYHGLAQPLEHSGPFAAWILAHRLLIPIFATDVLENASP